MSIPCVCHTHPMCVSHAFHGFKEKASLELAIAIASDFCYVSPPRELPLTCIVPPHSTVALSIAEANVSSHAIMCVTLSYVT